MIDEVARRQIRSLRDRFTELEQLVAHLLSEEEDQQ